MASSSYSSLAHLAPPPFILDNRQQRSSSPDSSERPTAKVTGRTRPVDMSVDWQKRDPYVGGGGILRNGIIGPGGGGEKKERSSSPDRKRADARRRRSWAKLRKPLITFVVLIALMVSIMLYQPGFAENWTPSFLASSSDDSPQATSQVLDDDSSTKLKTSPKSFTPSSYYPKSRRATTPSPFLPSLYPLPAYQEEAKVIYHNHPLSIHRPPSNQFILAPDAKFGSAVVGIITSTMNPRAVIMETAAALFGQSLQNWIWIIVSDHTVQADSIQLLKTLAKDPRITVLRNEGHKGLAQGRNVALRYIFGSNNIPPYLASLDDDDFYEFTALEKLVWLLESNKQWDLAGFPYVKWGAANETVWTGVHSGSANYQWGNFVPNAAMYRTAAVLNSGCRYDEISYADGGEDWDFWMCLASTGHWGGTVPEILYWYRQNPAVFRASRWGSTFINGFDSLKEKIQSKYTTLKEPGAFPSIPPRWSRQLETVSWTAPYDALLAHHSKTIMMVIPWLYVGGADIGALHMIQLYAEAGYRVTVLCTLYKAPEGVELRPEVLKWTHDVHVMPSFLRANDFPRYIKHLVESRGIEDVIFSNSQLIYEMLPALVEQLPQVKFVDYLHNEAYDGWKNGGYPTYSVISQRYLARTLTCSSYLRDWLIERGHAPERIGVVRLGIEIHDFTPVTPEVRDAAKAEMLALEPETLVIAFVGRLDRQKRPLLVPQIVSEILQSAGTAVLDFQVIMLGDGPLVDNLRREIETDELSDFVREFGTVSRPQDYLAAADIFLLPSVSEGISIAVAEAMAMGIPIVTARAGALPEQLGEGTDSMAGILVDHTLNDDIDAKLYADAIMGLMDSEKKRKEFGANARRNVETTFDWRDTLQGLFEQVEVAENLETHPGGGRATGKKKKKLKQMPPPPTTPHPAAYMAVQMILSDARPESDFAAAYSHLKTTI